MLKIKAILIFLKLRNVFTKYILDFFEIRGGLRLKMIRCTRSLIVWLYRQVNLFFYEKRGDGFI